MIYPIFNYIITIHNKEALIATVLKAVINCCGKNSFIYPVLDGCTDASEAIVDMIAAENKHVPIKKIKLNDVHEIISINEGLKAACQTKEGFNIILQDDIVLCDYTIEQKIIKIYQAAGCRLGYLSFRLGANFKQNTLSSAEGSPFTDYIENAYGHGTDNAGVLWPGELAFRSIAIKSPVCIPTAVINTLGLLDENLAPCFHDDTEYCLRLLKHGYQNGVYSIKFQSEIEWGGTREKPPNNLQYAIKKNMDYIRTLYETDISNLLSSAQHNKTIIIKEFSTEQEKKEALAQYKLNKYNRRKFITKDMNVIQKLKYHFVTMLKSL